jgi:hypothetical protein
MSRKVGSDNTDTFPTLHEVLYDEPDPRSPHLDEALTNLGVTGSVGWRLVLEGMAGDIKIARLSQRHRAATRLMVDRIPKAAKLIMAYMDHEEVRDALSVFAPLSPRDIGDVTGFEYLLKLAHRAERASAGIRVGKGRDSLQDNLDFPSPRLLCAACISEAMFKISGRRPDPAYEDAQVACHALWLAAGGADTSTVGVRGGLWERHLRDAKSNRTSAVRSARRTARSHVASAQQN